MLTPELWIPIASNVALSQALLCEKVKKRKEKLAVIMMVVFIPKHYMIHFYVTLTEGLGMCIHAPKKLSRCFSGVGSRCRSGYTESVNHC